ncbi:MAG TPA: glycoside hydrolase family 3 C-terminal domain-containing protein [Candidatus Ruminococcus gallistercoris]|nr:glycoside hydrolase family 3 C-terminal domain-containing protein [Candidatus Ruminococcus gallistercoris]
MRDRKEAQAKAKALVAQMTVEEKASQLKYDAPAIERLGVPAYNWWNEALHGVARAGTATMFPQPVAMASMFDEDTMRKIGDVVSTEARAKYNEAVKHGDHDIYKGLTFWSPNINLFRDPRWGRGQETYSEDPYLTARLGVAYIKGLQGDGEYLKVAACAKHFAVHSGPEALRHEFDAEVSRKDLWETYLPAFEAAVKEGGVESVMGAYNRTLGEPCCGSDLLMRKILRGKWGFEGHYVSDCWAIADFHNHHHITATAPESAALALKMGCDVNCGNTYLHLLQALEAGLITEDDITAAAERLFTTRFLLGEFDENCAYNAIPYETVECSEHLALSEEAARRSVVLLKNDGLLPLNLEKIRTIGVIGPNANDRMALIGNYHGTASRYITVLEGIQDYVGDRARVLYAEGCHLYRDRVEGLAQPGDRLAEAQTVVEHSDVVVLVVGLNENLEGEEMHESNAGGSGDKADLLLPAPQRKLMEVIAGTGKPVVLVNMTGSAMDLRFADAHFSAVVQGWYPGARGGKAIAELLFGKYSPSGKLPVTFYNSADDLPAFTDYAMENRTYRYFTGDVLYPFGFGLTYGRTAVTAASAEKAEGGWRVTASLEHSGAAGGDVVEVYIRDNESKFAVRNHSLCAFKPVSFSGDETKTVELFVPDRALEIVDDSGERRVDSRSFTLYVGVSQPDARSCALTGTRPAEIALQL